MLLAFLGLWCLWQVGRIYFGAVDLWLWLDHTRNCRRCRNMTYADWRRKTA